MCTQTSMDLWRAASRLLAARHIICRMAGGVEGVVRESVGRKGVMWQGVVRRGVVWQWCGVTGCGVAVVWWGSVLV